jgi:hypothetical protein
MAFLADSDFTAFNGPAQQPARSKVLLMMAAVK